ncbi:6-phosphogluconolactonase [Chlamydiales bacterium STE3]|nr:6-phosphogluconolactonase [Chlamydiales bacterium STE3]
MSLITSFDERRDCIIPGDSHTTIKFSAEHFLKTAKEEIDQKDLFTVALSGGSTPQTIYNELAVSPLAKQIEWDKVLFFFGDERSVPPEDKDSNYRMAFTSGLGDLPIPRENVFRMCAEVNIEENALQYEQEIIRHVPFKKFDLIMLGMGEDGHTASLFPETHGLQTQGRLVIANYVPQKKTWRMTLTYECINSAKNIAIYVMGATKARVVKEALQGSYQPSIFPVQKIGTFAHKALWILDHAAASYLE